MNPKNGLPMVMKGRDSGTSVTQKKPKERKMLTERTLRIALGWLLALGVPLAARADTLWTAVGQTGSMDETALNPVNFRKSSSGLSRGVNVTSWVIAYWNVENVNAPDDPTWDSLSLLNYDNSTVNQIFVFLRRHDRILGTVATIASMESSDSAGTKADTVNFATTWNFSRYSYSIEAFITGSDGDTTSQPVIKALTISD